MEKKIKKVKEEGGKNNFLRGLWGRKIRSNGKGKGLGRGRGEGPIGGR